MVTHVNLCYREDYKTKAVGASYLMLVNNRNNAVFCTVFAPDTGEASIQDVATELVLIYAGSDMDVWAVFPEPEQEVTPVELED